MSETTRCDRCQFWVKTGPDYGLCRMSSYDEIFADLPPVEQRLFHGQDLRAVTTYQAFGCVQFQEAKRSLANVGGHP